MRKSSAGFPHDRLALSNLVLLATSLHLFVGIVTHVLWLWRGNQQLFRYYFGYQDPLFLLLCTVLELSLAYVAWKDFFPGQALRRAWLLIMISAVCDVVGMTLTHILAANSYINPLYALKVQWLKAAAGTLVPLGRFIGGPLHMVALGGGLFLALRLCWQFRTQTTLKATDWVILGFVVAYAFLVAYVVVRMRWGARPAPRWTEVMNWANDPLLAVLLFFAFFLRRSLVHRGWGVVTRCWGAYVVAILGTSLASMGAWATNFGVLPYPESAILWYIWPIIYAAFALGPAYQVEAVSFALARLHDLDPEGSLDTVGLPN